MSGNQSMDEPGFLMGGTSDGKTKKHTHSEQEKKYGYWAMTSTKVGIELSNSKNPHTQNVAGTQELPNKKSFNHSSWINSLGVVGLLRYASN